MAKGSKKNKERAAAQANKARRVEKRNAAAAQPTAANTTSETKPKKSLKKIRRQKDKKRAANAEKRLPNQIAAQKNALKADLKEAEKFNASFSIDGKAFSYRDPKNLENAELGSRNDRGITDEKYNPNSYEYTDPLYQYSAGRVSDAARALDISNVNSKKEVDRILSQIRNPQSAALPQINTPDNNNNKNKKNKKNKRDNEPSVAETVEPAPDNRIQELQDSFKEQISGLMDSMSGYQQQFLDQQANYDQKMLDMRNTLSAQMNPQRRNPIFGIRTPGMGSLARSIRNSFGRGGSRIGGIRNTTLNLS